MRAVPLGFIQSRFPEGHGDGNLNTAVVAVLYGELVALAVKASQPLAEIRQTDARGAVFPVCGEGGSVVVHGAADSCGALKLFVNVATIRSDAFWFSAVP